MSQGSGISQHSIESLRSQSNAGKVPQYEVRGAQVVPIQNQRVVPPVAGGAVPINGAAPPARAPSPGTRAPSPGYYQGLPPLSQPRPNYNFAYSVEPPQRFGGIPPTQLSQMPAPSAEEAAIPQEQEPSTSSSKRKKQARVPEMTKAQREKAELARLEPIILQLTFKHKDRVICREEFMDDGNGGGNVLVAKWIEIGSEKKGNYEKVDIDRFNYKTVRKLAANFGCKGVSALSKQDCRKRLAIRLTSGTVYDLDEIANPVTEASTKKTNTIV
jgi:hypothetical protein